MNNLLLGNRYNVSKYNERRNRSRKKTALLEN